MLSLLHCNAKTTVYVCYMQHSLKMIFSSRVPNLTRQRLMCIDVSRLHQKGVHAVVASLCDQLSHDHATVRCLAHCNVKVITYEFNVIV